MLQIKIIKRGVKNYRLELVNGEKVLFTGHYKDFTKKQAVDHFKKLLDENAEKIKKEI